MRVNVITYNNNYGLSNDAKILELSLKKKFKNINIKYVDFYSYKCELADINIYLETVSNIFMDRARVNVLIPNQEYFYKTWTNYIEKFDYILTKTEYARSIFSAYKFNNLNNIGWKSIDRYNHTTDKNYNAFIHVCGNSIYKNTKTIIDLWKPNYPNLLIIYNAKNPILFKMSLKRQNNIKYIAEHLDTNKFNRLFNQFGLHLCPSETEGFGHYINEAKMCKSLVVTLDAPPMNTLINNKIGFLVKSKKKIKLKHTLGSKYTIDHDDFDNVIQKIMNMSLKEKQNIGILAQKDAINFNKTFENNLHTCFSEIISNVRNTEKKIDTIIDDDKLPNISIVTPTYNRRNMVKLMLLNYKIMDYPIEKREWIIIDDGSEKILDLLPNDSDRWKLNIKYYSIEEKMVIGKKRNLGVEKANNDIIVFMDDDDFYPPESTKIRVSALLNNKKDCVGCSTIGCFHINKMISIINVPPHKLALEQRLSEATLCFKKKFWLEQKFNDNSIGTEAYEFIKNRNTNFSEISWEKVIVSLLHSRNTSTKITYSEEPNGCHFGWSDQLFLFITNLDKE